MTLSVGKYLYSFISSNKTLAITKQLIAGTQNIRRYVQPVTQQLIETEEAATAKKERQECKEVISKVNEQLQQHKEGRTFAVVQVCGKQFKVTTEDVIVIEGYWAPEAGERLRLEKVLLAGASDFTLIGRPLLPPDLVSVHATVVEKAMSHIKTTFKFKKRKQFRRIHFHRIPHTMLRINDITITPEVNKSKEIEGVEKRIF